MCEYPWSNLDVFQVFTDCHIYLPIYYFLMISHIIIGIFATFYSIRELIKRKRKNIPFFCTLNEFFFSLSYILCLSTNETFASGNYILNFIYGISRGGLYVVTNFLTLRNVEVLLVIDKIKPERDSSLKMTQLIMTRIIFLTIPVEALGATLPLAFPNQLPLSYTIFYVPLVLCTLIAPISWFYLYTLKKKLSLMTTSRNVYNRVEDKLSKLLNVSIWGYIFTLIPSFLLLYVPIFHRNTYIAYNIPAILVHLPTFQVLYATSVTVDDQPTSKHSLHLETGDTKKNSSKSNPLTRPCDISIDQERDTKIPSSLSTPCLTSIEDRDLYCAIPLFNPFSTTSPSNSNVQIQMEVLVDNQIKENVLDLDLTGKLDRQNGNPEKEEFDVK